MRDVEGRTAKLHPTTPDGRYFVVRGKLWRCSNPALSNDERSLLVADLMRARRMVGSAKRRDDAQQLAEARAAVEKAKVALGERGPVWRDDDAPDFNRFLVRSTPYAEWYRTAAIDGDPVLLTRAAPEQCS